MHRYDSVIVGGCLVTPDAEVHQDLGIQDGLITAIEHSLTGQGREEIVAEGNYVLPGIIDSHVHINEPGNTAWEGFETGSRAALAGGVTCLFDMPLNSLPTTTNVEALELKKACAEEKCLTDFALWGGLVPDNIDDLEGLFEAGVIGFKGFMVNSGLQEFPCIDEVALKAGMNAIAKLPGMRLALHAEDEALTAKRTRQCLDQERITTGDFLHSRPIEAELIAISRAVEIAGETGCPIHIVHVSCPEGIDLVNEAKQAGTDITVETCPHYLSLTQEATHIIGALAKCAPPLRSSTTVEGLLKKVRSGELDTIGSDHSPCPESMKISDNFFEAWGGISSLQHAGPITYSLLYNQLGMPLNSIAKLTSQHPSKIFNLKKKGALELGKDADFFIGNFANTQTIKKEDLYYRNAHSPYLDTAPQFQVLKTFLRGKTGFREGRFNESRKGKFVRPTQ